MWLLVWAGKLYGLGILYLLFLTGSARPQVDASFLFLEPGEKRDGQIREIEESFWHRLGPFDGQWYLDIAAKGYRRFPPSESARRGLPPGNYAFFPLLPALIRGIRTVALSCYVPVTVALLLALSSAGVVVAWHLARELGYSGEIVAALLLTFPSAVFQYFLYTEGIFLLLSSLALFSALKRERGRAALFGMLCGLSRPQGILLAVPFAWEFLWRDGRSDPGRRLGGAAVTLAPLSGFVAMAAVSAVVADSPLAFMSIQSNWGRSTGFGGLLGSFGDFLEFRGPPFDLITAALAILLLPWIWARLPRSLALYGTALVLLPLATGSLLSFGRFLSVSIPHFLCLAALLRDRPLRLGAVLLGFTACQLVLGKALVSWFFVG